MNEEKQYNQELQERVEGFLAEKEVSQAKAAPMMGISQTALSQWRRSMYDKGNVEELENKISEFFRAQDAREKSEEKTMPYRMIGEYVPTSISEDVYQLIKYCQLEKGMVVIHGDAGIGKTKGAEKFARENPASTIYIQAAPSSGTLKSTLKLLARSLKLSESRSNLDMILDIREKLEGTQKVIIIDEAQHLKLSALEEIRTLSDENPISNHSGTGIVLIGNTEVYSRMVGRQEARFAQLFSRVRMNRYYSTQRVTISDMKLLFPRLAQEDQKRELEFLRGISQSKWGIRGAVNVYNNAVNNENITYKGLYSMARAMGIGILG